MESLWNATSIKTRFLVSVSANILRNLANLGAGLLVARGLGPYGYGDLMFLLGSFIAVRQLLDMGSSSAFYTFLSQKPRGRSFYMLYFGFLAAQFITVVVLVMLLMPRVMVEYLWLGHGREVILLAFGASFMQNQAWLSVVQIGEASRQTVRVQMLTLSVAIFHIVLLVILLVNAWMSVPVLLTLFILEYLLATVFAYRVLRANLKTPDAMSEPVSPWQVLEEYRVYCTPLILYSLVCFAYEFGDRWMLQHFGGSEQQGFYQIGYQFSAASLIATTSILKIFWKEITEADARQDRERVRMFYQKTSRGLLMFGAILSGFMIPWSKAILPLLLGAEYAPAWPVLAIMFLFPIHQSMGQIGGTMFLATGKTRILVIFGIIFMLVSLPVSYVAQAPPDAMIPGLGLGAVGMALKMVLLNMIGVNIMAWMIARVYGWQYDWTYQVVGIASLIAIGFFSQQVVGWVWDLNSKGISLLIPIAFSGLLYVSAVAGLLWALPWLVGMERAEMRAILRRR